MAFLDPSQFSLGTEPDMRSFQDRMLELRRTLPPAIAAQQPPIPGQPQQTQQESQSANLANSINQVAQTVGQRLPQQQPMPEVQQIVQASQQALGPKITQQLVKEATNLEPPKLVGPDVFGRGGIMGTGLEPLDVLAFAIGAAVTSNLPQDQAMARTFQIAGLPKMFKDNQRKAVQDWITQATGAANANTAMANAQIAQSKAGMAKQQYDSGLQLAEVFRKAGRPADALALEADKVAEYVKLTGGTPDKLPTQMEQWMSGIISGVVPENQIPQQLRDVGIVNREAASRWYEQYLRSRPITVTPEGIPIQRTPQGPAALTDQSQLAQPLGRGPAGPVAAPGVAPVAPMPGAPAMQPPIGQPAPVGRPVDQSAAQLPPEAQDWQKNMQHADGQPLQTAAFAQPLFARGVDESTAAKMLAGHGTGEFAKSLYQKYESMIKSYGGDKGYTPEIAAKLYAITMAATLSGEGITGAVFTQLGQGISAVAQRYGTKLTPEAEDFIAEMAQAQGFAKGSLQDAANIAVRERQFFFGMIGSTLDKPSVARKKFAQFYNTAQNNYNSALELAARRGKNVAGFVPMAKTLEEAVGGRSGPLGSRTQQPAQPESRIIQTPNGQLPAGWEPVAPRVSGEY